MLIFAETALARASLTALVRSIAEREPDMDVLLSADPEDRDELGIEACKALPSLARLSRRDLAQIFDSEAPEIMLVFASSMPAAAVRAATARGVRVHLICDATPSELPRGVLRNLTHVFAADSRQVIALRKLGVPDSAIVVTGRLSSGRPPPHCDWNEHARLSSLLAGRPMWFANAAHAGEIPTLIAAHARAARLSHRLLLILSPVDMSSADQMAEDLRAQGWRVARRSKADEPTEETQIFLCDEEDESGLFCRLSPLTFVGGTLVPSQGATGGNPAHPAALGSAVIHGPFTGRHENFARRLDAAKAARLVVDAPSLTRALEALIAPDKSAQLARNAWEVVTEGAEATELVVSTLVARPARQREAA
ncbi:3-deoxy-D-manno-octulosonic acid transferase [Actibacterium mucosum]|uniref:3-deoxy-D-manno-octulosonic acid transferase n=1 Tax=Actibacterium mucosum TaxID=1087332 RepID=UPI000B0F253D|nr:hypothetical protein [Actibacterium mucosum]